MAAMELTLRANNQRVAVVIATDGESSDGDIAAAMAPLQQLPVHVVIRLCTDQDSIVDYWNNIDKSLGISMLIAIYHDFYRDAIDAAMCCC